MKKILGVLGILVVALAVGSFLYVRRGKNGEAKYRWSKIDRGTVTATVTATGTLSAVTTVNVGSQVSGIISKLFADFNSVVRKGQLLAELDPTPFQQTVDQRRADLQKAKVELRNTEISLTRAKNLFRQELEAQSDLDAAQTTRDSDAAAVEQASAALKQAETNLSYTRITSPIDGVVVTRAYDIGQTVAASFQAPVLFTIAQDLTKMQVLTNIDEADVGQIRLGQVATFTVDAFPDAVFKGVRLADPPLAADGPERRDVPRHARRPEPGPEAQAGDDGERPRPGRYARGRPSRPELGPPLQARLGGPLGRPVEEERGGPGLEGGRRQRRPRLRRAPAAGPAAGESGGARRARRRAGPAGRRPCLLPGRDGLRGGAGNEGEAEGRHLEDDDHRRQLHGGRFVRSEGRRRDRRRPRHGARRSAGRRRAGRRRRPF